MSTKQFSEALGEIDGQYIERAMTYQAKKPSAFHTKRRLLPLAAAIAAILLMGTAVSAVILHGDLWLQNPSKDPVEVVRSALENQAEKNYTVKIEVESVEIDEAETERVVERFIKGVIADQHHWSDQYLAEHFLVVKAVYYAEYDHSKTARSDGEVTMYFYLTQDVDSGTWTVFDNSGNVNRPENNPADESTVPAVESVEDQLFSYLSELFCEAYAPYYDGMRYEMSQYQESMDGNSVTATFLWTQYFLGKEWGPDAGAESQANWFLQATAKVGEDGALDLETISVLVNVVVNGIPDYSSPIENWFPTQLAD